jgi:hypothetical protein
VVALLTRCALLCSLLCGTALAAEIEPRQHWDIQLDFGLTAASTPLRAWPESGFGKLRYDGRGTPWSTERLLLDYRARLADTLVAHAVLDYVDDASPGLGLTESYIEWRPVPSSRNIQRWRFGAFYPPMSLENGGPGWSAPLSTSSSAINTWLGEEIRAFGAEWSMHRRLFAAGSPHRIGFAAAAFYGNDPAGTLLFWRGWSVHDRQTRLSDTLPLPPRPEFSAAGTVVGLEPQTVRPFTETDHRPGFYATVEWRYARRVLLQLSAYDNRALPESFADGQWGWRTEFAQLAAQIALPGGFGVITQWLSGQTDWIVATTPTGLTTPASRLVSDRFDAAFVALTKRLSGTQRILLRYDDFSYVRPVQSPELRADDGDAWTVSYRIEPVSRLSIAAEWLVIRSSRDLWSAFYGLPANERERRLRLRFILRLAPRSASP